MGQIVHRDDEGLWGSVVRAMTDTTEAEKFWRSRLQIIEAAGAFTVWQQIGGQNGEGRQ